MPAPTPAPTQPSGPSPPALRLLFLLALAAGCFHGLGAAPLFDLDEGAFAEATREMLERGDLVSPYLLGEPRFDKPAFVHWLQAASVSLFGWSEWALRLPSALCAALWILLATAALARVWGERPALLAGAAMAASLEIPVLAKAATADALLNLWLAAACLALWLHLREGRRLWLLAAYAAAGLGFLAKGPVAVAVPAALAALHLLMRGEPGRLLRLAAEPWGWALFLGIALPWYLLQYRAQGWAFVEGFFLHHNVGRFGGTLEGHGGPLWYYLPVVLAGVLPYTAVLLAGVPRLRGLWREPERRYMLLWFLLVLALFSLSGTKLPHYVVYGYTGLFALLGLALAEGPLPRPLWLFLPPLLWFLLLLALPALLEAWAARLDDPLARTQLAEAGDPFGPWWTPALAGAAALMVAWMLLPERRPWPGRASRLLTAGLATTLSVSGLLLPAVGQVRQAPVQALGLLARERPEPVVMWGVNLPSFAVYAQRLTPRRLPRPGELVFTRADRLEALPGRWRVLHRRGGLVLALALP